MQKLKILLINPPIKPQNPPYNIPLGLACIAAVIDAKGHDVAIFDNNAYRLGIDEIIGQIKTVPWDMICLGNLVTTYPWQKAMIKRVRKEFPGPFFRWVEGLLPASSRTLWNGFLKLIFLLSVKENALSVKFWKILRIEPGKMSGEYCTGKRGKFTGPLPNTSCLKKN